MNGYTHRVILTAWRKKTTLIIATVLITIIIFGLQYSSKLQTKRDRSTGELSRNSVLYLEAQQRRARVVTGGQDDFDGLAKQPTRDEIGAEKFVEEQRIARQNEQELGIPHVNLHAQNPYIPKKRLVHLDLKGAPPKMSYIMKLLPLLKNLGATGILLEYEDMFPFEGSLKRISAKNAYTRQEIKDMLQLAHDLKLQVIPLIQTFGHVEFVLKHKQFINIREVSNSPQALCPSKNRSLDFISELIHQVLDMHPKTKFLHIGCDEVFQMGECELCRLELHDTLFLKHIQNVANLVRDKRPGMRVIIWDDMLRHLTVEAMLGARLGQLVEPMIWVYAEDIYRFVQPQIWEKYGAVFRTAWTASAFKGAFGETLYIPDARRHLENNLRWLDIMSQQRQTFKGGLSGIVLTGWQRYDHFAVLCELLPAAIPSLALSLLAVSNGFFNSSLKSHLLNTLSCPQYSGSRNSPFIDLSIDPHLWDKLGRCMFPGSPFFRLTFRLNVVENEVVEYLKVTTKNKGWLTDYNLRHNYSLPLRVEELTDDLPRVYHGALSLARSAYETMNSVFDNYTISEWVEQRIYPYIIQLETLQNQSDTLKSVNVWPVRPLPPLKDLYRLGVPVP